MKHPDEVQSRPHRQGIFRAWAEWSAAALIGNAPSTNPETKVNFW
jgi:hypothetical protein